MVEVVVAVAVAVDVVSEGEVCEMITILMI